jgi:adenylylsulfate kinase-like enzyme
MNKTPWALLLTGMPNCGKTTLAYELCQKRVRNALIIDGDKHREMQFLGYELGFSRADIMTNTEHVVKMAQFAQGQDINVIISQIAPYRIQRDTMKVNLQNFFDVHCHCSLEVRSQRPNFKDSELVYETGGHDLVIDTGELDIDTCIDRILAGWRPWGNQ